MRDTLENLYFGNITPNDQIVKSGTALKKAMEQSAECEEQLAALLEGKEKTLQSRKGCNASFCHIQLCTDSLFVRVFDFRNLFRRSSHNP